MFALHVSSIALTNETFYHCFQLDTLTKHIEKKLEEKRKETFAWKTKYNIKTQEEMEAAQKQ